tara:strand:- start:4770 stop:10082 length:5313 start_codon:yes stop_codon:yes gene_type:complete
MPEIKNTFIQSKMNKDMDGRIIPNGQYRDGQNVQISRSEGDDVGALETVLGNGLLTTFGLTDPNITCIGKLFDDSRDTIYVFLTNYTDSSATQLSNSTTNIAGVKSYIASYNLSTGTPTILVEGNFLNFSKTHLILGVNIIEDLLFWTDNRNQPRKINVTSPAGYYYNEDQISVAKYYPYEAPLLLDIPQGLFPSPDNPFYESSMRDVSSKYLPIHTNAKVLQIDTINNEIFVEGCKWNIKPQTPSGNQFDGNLVTKTGGKGTLTEKSGVTVTTCDVFQATDRTKLRFTGGFTTLDTMSIGDILNFQFLNPEYDSAWGGDSQYLKERFVRFSYRLKFDDGEYSLSAPFTQIAFVPEQDGYFIGDKVVTSTEEGNAIAQTLIGQESEAFDTTIVKFMENKITDININLMAPTKGNAASRYLWSEVNDKLKVVAIDILYKEADSNKITILDTVELGGFNGNQTSILSYNYQSRKPWKTLSPAQTTRVQDVVPVRALAQESAGNRIMYGNFIDKHTSPISLNYTLQIGDKPQIPSYQNSQLRNDETQYVRKEYQNHTLKQNRSYQVGIVLADRYGRQSNVILSSVLVDSISAEKKGSTIYHSFKNVEDQIINDRYEFAGEADTWPGDMLRITFENIIPTAKLNNGYPGVYSVNDNTLSDVLINYTQSDSLPTCATNSFVTLLGPTSLSGSQPSATMYFKVDSNGIIYDIRISNSTSDWENGMSFEADWTNAGAGCASLLGKVIKGVVETPLDNPLGWYSYKAVIKQTEQEYYNVYLPTALAGYPADQNPDNLTPQTITVQTNTTPGPPPNENQQVNENEATYGKTPHLVYPVGEDESTSHLVLFSDNINKIPKDLQEVGPMQEEFRSSAILFPRVNTFLLKDLIGDYSYSSSQYLPPTKGDRVISISNMTRLGLGEIITNPEEPVIPNLFYKGETDPFIARLSTEKKLGISKNFPNVVGNEFDPPNASAGFVPSTISVVKDTKYAFGPTLTVCETKPVESLLDIFWESSTSGLISTLNNNILNSDNTIPIGISNPDITWSEKDDYGTIISADFQALGFGQTPLGASVTITLDSVISLGNTNRTSSFLLNSLGNGKYNISIAPYSGANSNFICSGNSLENIFTFNFTVTSTNTSNVITIQSQGEVFNRAPNERQFWRRDVLKDAICSRAYQYSLSETAGGGTYDEQNDLIINSSLMALKAEQGSQKMGLKLYSEFQAEQPIGGENSQPFRLFPYTSETEFINGEINYGRILSPPIKWTTSAVGRPNIPTKFSSNVEWQGQYNFFSTWPVGGYIDNYESGYTLQLTSNAVADGSLQVAYYSPTPSNLLDSRKGVTNYGHKLWTNQDPIQIAQFDSILSICGCDLENNMDNVDDPIKVAGSFDYFWNKTSSGNPFDGKFVAANGTWESVQDPPSPEIPFPGPGEGLEIVFDIVRMYQVSMMIPYPEMTLTELAQATNESGFLNDDYERLNVQSAQEIIFGGPQDSFGGSSFTFPLTPAQFTTNGDISTKEAFSRFQNTIIEDLPTGPIYWDFDPSGTQLNPSLGGEALVGQKYNKYLDPNPPTSQLSGGYPHHYWPDINQRLQNDPKYSDFRASGNLADAPSWMKLQNGANTFYQWSEEFCKNFKEINLSETFPGSGNTETNFLHYWSPAGNQISANAAGYKYYINGLGSLNGVDGLGPSRPNNNCRFWVDQPTGQPTNAPLHAYIHAGNPSIASASVIQALNTVGNGMPGGRYVVTIRARDKNGSSTAGQYEWDVPITLPWWKTRANKTWSCTPD